MKNKMPSETDLARLVKEKRDAAEQRRAAKEKAKKQKQQEEKARLAEQKKAERATALKREKRIAERKRIEREQTLRRKRLLSGALADLSAAAIEGSKHYRADANILEVRPELEKQGFEFYDQTESTYNSETLVKRLKAIAVKQKTVQMQLAKAQDRLDGYLRDELIPKEDANAKAADWLIDGGTTYSFEEAFGIFQELMDLQEKLRDEVKYWDDLQSMAVWVVKEIHSGFQGLADNQVEKAISQKSRYWHGRLEDHEDWLANHPNLIRELPKFYRDLTVLISIDERLESEREDITNKLNSNEQTVFTYVAWRKKPTARSNKSEKYHELHWLSSSAANTLFKRISEYLVRHANKSKASFFLSVDPNSDEQKLKVGRESFVIPRAVKAKTIIAKLEAWGFTAKEVRAKDLDHTWISVNW